MLERLPVSLIAGGALGFLSGIGVGGGSLLILWLTMVLHMPHSAARGINLLFFLPAAVICACFRCRQGKIPFRKILPAIISGCIAAAVFSYLSTLIDVTALQKLFGGLLILTGLREVVYKKKKEGQWPSFYPF
jgi:uncharacterized membrane protein YfcA